MGHSLRKKLSKAKPSSNLEAAKSEADDASSADWPSDDSKRTSASKPTERRSSHLHYRNTPPPLQNQLRSRETSSSPSLLLRYKIRSAGQRVMASPSVNAVKNADGHIVGEGTTSSGHAVREQPPTPPGKFEQARTPEIELSRERKRVNGVEFEMMSRKSTTPSILSQTSDSGPRVSERRQTRSDTRRQERSDSHNSLLQPPVAEIQGVTIRKVRDAERTPSPRINGDEDKITSDSPDELTLSQIKKDVEGRVARPLPSPPNSEETSSTRSRLPVSPNSNITRPKLSSYRRSQQAKTGTDNEVTTELEPTVVAPPRYNSQVPAPYIWVSSLSSSSRPCDPWGWSKKWTCCQCADLDPWGRDEPAQTIVEQKVCSRVECGHERCRRGCRI